MRPLRRRVPLCQTLNEMPKHELEHAHAIHTHASDAIHAPATFVTYTNDFSLHACIVLAGLVTVQIDPLVAIIMLFLLLSDTSHFVYLASRTPASLAPVHTYHHTCHYSNLICLFVVPFSARKKSCH